MSPERPERPNLGSISIPSSGDPVADQRRLVRFLYDDLAIHAGLCPNGCGPMADDVDPGWARACSCQLCGFEYRSRPL